MKVSHQTLVCHHNASSAASGAFAFPDGSTATVLSCEAIQNWCPMPILKNGTVVDPVPVPAFVSLGSDISLACNTAYTHLSGSQQLLCGFGLDGKSGEWRSLDGGTAKPLACTPLRTWCPPLFPVNSIVEEQAPFFEIFSKASHSCMRGFRHVSGDREVKCMTNANGTAGEWRSTSEVALVNGTLAELPYHCEPIPDYCPPFAGVSTQPSGIGTGPLYTKVEMSCLLNHFRILGDEKIICGHPDEGSSWRRDVPGEDLVMKPAATPLTCGYRSEHGVRRHGFRNTQWQRSYSTDTDGKTPAIEDIMLNIEQTTSEWDSTHFVTVVKPTHSGIYRFHVEAIGRIILTGLNGDILLNNASSNSSYEEFTTAPVNLNASELYDLSLQYSFMPAAQLSTKPMPAHVKLLWSSDSVPKEVVAPSNLYHTFSGVRDFPAMVSQLNDPTPCSGEVVHISGLQPEDQGTLVDGSPDHNYNPNLHCKWRLESAATPHMLDYRLYAMFFDVELSDNCEHDHILVRSGNDENAAIKGRYCGTYPLGHLLHSEQKQGGSIFVEFKTNAFNERPGFKIVYELLKMV
eukprot:gnl/MRDRNA2_/MRDRNA2_32639_c0_seq1.p1 gnl/MRDRNA2_/MRDRNA2_32639_c0~~gnl/MRDRNA2_/MRDRNA2_32639_c0_seq1.p1  ORF type:complete len:648 (+),score=99.03 gnl/MRDRNA2_/MRDRNA2_32639_c0_seq1:228-1946(+)